MKKILINILTHGNEFVGSKVVEEIERKYSDIFGKHIYIQIANKLANTKRKRFISHDLNRVFPGKESGSYEEKRAYTLSKKIREYDIVLDIHSTESGSGDMLIITKLKKETLKIIEHISPKYVLYMSMRPDKSLISAAKIGIAFEMGSDHSPDTVRKTVLGIERVLDYCGIIESKKKLSTKTLFFKVIDEVSKADKSKLEKHIKNFKLIKKGEVYARTKKGDPIISTKNFFPVIFGNTNYKTIFGFAAEKL